MWEILSNMLLGLSVVFVSDSPKTLVQIIEVFRSLMYPYVYQGLIVPFDPEPNYNLLTSNLAYMLGKTLFLILTNSNILLFYRMQESQAETTS